MYLIFCRPHPDQAKADSCPAGAVRSWERTRHATRPGFEELQRAGLEGSTWEGLRPGMTRGSTVVFGVQSGGALQRVICFRGTWWWTIELWGAQMFHFAKLFILVEGSHLIKTKIVPPNKLDYSVSWFHWVWLFCGIQSSIRERADTKKRVFWIMLRVAT